MSRTEPIDLRRDDRLSVVVIPERFPGGALTPCSYIRLLQPLDHPAIGGDFDIVLAEADEALTVSQLMSSSRSAMRWLISTPPMR